MPVALRAGSAEVEEEGAESSWERSRPRVFFTACLAFADLGVARASFSSSARRASFSAFLRAASCFFCSASSLFSTGEGNVSREVFCWEERRKQTFLRVIWRLYSILGLRPPLSLRFLQRLFGSRLRLSREGLDKDSGDIKN